MMGFDRDKRGSYKEDAPKKTPIVTKKMLADSGHDNLRDYLNAQRGLTRRKAEEPEKKSAPAAAAGGKKSEMVGALDEATRKMSADTSPLAKKNIMEARRKAMEDYDNADRAEGMKAYKPRATDIEDAKPMTKMSLQGEDYKKGGSVKKYAKGGSVSGRADGIAKKGKTNCKMV
jgi:hypothetical protein